MHKKAAAIGNGINAEGLGVPSFKHFLQLGTCSVLFFAHFLFDREFCCCAMNLPKFRASSSKLFLRL